MTRTYGKLKRVDEFTWRISDLEPHVAIRLKAIFPRVPKHSRGPFDVPDTDAMAADLAWFTSRYGLEIGEGDSAALAAGARGFEATQAEVGRMMVSEYAPRAFVGLKPGQEVRPHQARNAELLLKFGGLLCADEIGEGKTYTGGACCLLPGALPATIVCPPHLATQWRDKLEGFTELSVHVVTKTRPYQLPPVDVRIFGYTQIAGWVDVLEMLGTGLMIIEEGHALRRGPGTPSQPVAKGIAALRLSEVSRMRLMLTGSPIFNYGEEIWNLLSYIRPEVLGEEEDFRREWCHGRRVHDPDALRTFLVEQHAMTRKKGQGPKPNVIVHNVDYDAGRLASVEELARSLALKATSDLTSWHERGEAVRELDMRMRQETGIAKAPYVAKFVRVLVEAGEKVVLFGWHRDVYDIWLDALIDLGCVMYTGTESNAEKAKSVQKFLAGEAAVFIMSLRSGEGLDGLQHCCSTAVIGELDWSPKVHDQNIGRLNREGQPRWKVEDGRVDAYYLVADDGADPPMMEVLGVKASQAHHIVDGGIAERHSDLNPMEKLIQRYLVGRAA
jgi:hypothetical protein